MRRSGLAAAAALLLLLPACSDPVARRADALMTDLYRQGGFTGAVVIMQDGKTVYERGFGMANESLPFAPDTASESGSLAKPVTAAAIHLLAAEGRIDLDLPVQSYLAEFPYPGTTIRNLLSHSGGLPDYDMFEDLWASGAPTDNLSIIKAMAERQPAPRFPAGEQFEYCNICFDTLGAVIARVTGGTYEDFIAERFFAPAGMTDTYVRPAHFKDWPGPRALGYKIRPAGTTPFDIFDNEGVHGGCNINFSARDIARWGSLWAMEADAIEPVRGAAVKNATIGDKTSPLTLGSWYCTASRTACYYTGHHQAFHAFAYWNAETRVAIGFISNNTLTSPLQPALARALVATAHGEQPETLTFDVALEDQQADLTAVAGAYRTEEIGDFTIALEGDAAVLELENSLRMRLFPIGFNTLYAPGVDAYLSLEPGAGALLWKSTFVGERAVRR
jgi:CubicO group peptidase (beta-lactamase class C family)